MIDDLTSKLKASRLSHPWFVHLPCSWCVEKLEYRNRATPYPRYIQRYFRIHRSVQLLVCSCQGCDMFSQLSSTNALRCHPVTYLGMMNVKVLYLAFLKSSTVHNRVPLLGVNVGMFAHSKGHINSVIGAWNVTMVSQYCNRSDDVSPSPCPVNGHIQNISSYVCFSCLLSQNHKR